MGAALMDAAGQRESVREGRTVRSRPSYLHLLQCPAAGQDSPVAPVHRDTVCHRWVTALLRRPNCCRFDNYWLSRNTVTATIGYSSLSDRLNDLQTFGDLSPDRVPRRKSCVLVHQEKL